MDAFASRSTFNNFFGLEKKLFKLEKFFSSPRIDVWEFLKVVAPKRIKILREVLTLIGWRFDGPFVVDLGLSTNVAGYWNKNLNIIAINPFILLFGNKRELAHVIIHEGHHAGVYGAKIAEEVLVERQTKIMMKKIFGEVGIETGYDKIVKIFSTYVSGMSYEQVYALIKDGDPDTLHNMVELVVGKPILDSKNILQLQWQNINYQLRQKWEVLTTLFPRTVNSAFKTNAGVHDQAKVHPSEYKLEELQKRMANKIVHPSNIHLVREIFDKSFSGLAEYKVAKMLTILAKNGYQYLVDFEGNTIQRELFAYISGKEQEKRRWTNRSYGWRFAMAAG